MLRRRGFSVAAMVASRSPRTAGLLDGELLHAPVTFDPFTSARRLQLGCCEHGPRLVAWLPMTPGCIELNLAPLRHFRLAEQSPPRTRLARRTSSALESVMSCTPSASSVRTPVCLGGCDDEHPQAQRRVGVRLFDSASRGVGCHRERVMSGWPPTTPNGERLRGVDRIWPGWPRRPRR